MNINFHGFSLDLAGGGVVHVVAGVALPPYDEGKVLALARSQLAEQDPEGHGTSTTLARHQTKLGPVGVVTAVCAVQPEDKADG